MGLDLKDVLGNSSADRGARRNTARIVAAAGGVGLVVILILLVAAMGGGEVAADSGATTTGADAASALRAGPAPARPEIPAEVAKLLAPYPGRQLLEGTEMAGRGEFEAAEDWLARFLDMPDSRSDQALLALALVERQTGKALAAEDTLRRLLRERKDSPRAGDGAYVLGLMLAEAGRPDEARKSFSEATEVYPESRGGTLAAKRLADELYDEHVVQKTRRCEWERVRDLYSIALGGLDEGDPARAEVVARLNRLNDWVIFAPHSRPAEGYPSSVAVHTVGVGEVLDVIARKYGVTVRAVQRLNGIPFDNYVIQPGQPLKILRGRCRIVVDANAMKMVVSINGRFFREYPVGIGRDGRTPVGTFRIETRAIDPSWWQGGEEIPPWDPRNVLGSRWLGFERTGAGRGIGIHGSRQREDGVWEGVGAAESNGCIRMRNPDVEELYDFVVTGTEVEIVE